MPIPSHACEYLKWDSEFFGYRTARCQSVAHVNAAEKWCHDNRIDCLYLLIPAPDYPQAEKLTEGGFCLVDVRCEFGKSLLPGKSEKSDCELATAADEPALHRLAGTAFSDSRFAKDPHFASRSSALYRAWISKSLNQPESEAVLIFRSGGEIQGFISVKRTPKGQGRIELIAVSPKVRGAGLGEKLLVAGENYLSEWGMQSISVATQIANRSAIRLYEKADYRFQNSTFCYHRWFTETEVSAKAAA